MPGVKGRSGRRGLLPTASDIAIPDMGDTEDSVRLYLSAVAKAVAQSRMDPRTGDTMIKAANGVLTALKHRHNRTAVAELRQLLDEAKSVAKAGLAREVADRQHAKK